MIQIERIEMAQVSHIHLYFIRQRAQEGFSICQEKEKERNVPILIMDGGVTKAIIKEKKGVRDQLLHCAGHCVYQWRRNLQTGT